MKNPRLLLVVNSPTNYLSKRQELAQAAADHGFEVHLATPNHESLPNLADVSVHSISLNRRSTNPVRELHSLLSFLRTYRSVQPDIVHHFTIKPITYGSIAARILRIPVVVNNFTGLGTAFQGGDSGSSILQRTILKALKFGANRPNVRFVFQNPDDEAFMRKMGITVPNQSTVIRSSGVRIDQYESTDDTANPPLVILPARMLWAKGIEDFVEAAIQLDESGANARFALIGDTDDGNPDTIPREQLEMWDEVTPVEWWGWCDDMNQVYSEASIVCLPSYREGVPQVILEAAASQLPVVATNVPGCRDAVIDGKTGVLVPKNDPTELANALNTLIEDYDLRCQLGRCGRDLVKDEFTRENIVKQTLEVYYDLLE